MNGDYLFCFINEKNEEQEKKKKKMNLKKFTISHNFLNSLSCCFHPTCLNIANQI